MLLMGMLFSGSELMTVIITIYLDWDFVLSQDWALLKPRDMLPETCSSLANLFADVVSRCMLWEKGLSKTFTDLKYSFYLFSAAN